MTTPTVSLHFTVQQGATFRPVWKRYQVPAEAIVRNGTLVYKASGKAVPQPDMVPVDYTGCKARMQMRASVDAPDVLLTFSTQPQEGEGVITLGADGAVGLELSPMQTSALPYGDGAGQWRQACGQMEVEFANGDIERHFEIHLCLDPEGTRGD